MKSTKFWLGIIIAALAVFGILSMSMFHGRHGDAVAVIYQDGEPVRTIDLTKVKEPYSFTMEWEGGYNIIEVERDRIRVSEADCPDQVCVRQGWISEGIVPIACLPHHLAIRLASSGDAIVDGVVG